MAIKLIATDLDATFLHDDKHFDEALFTQVLKTLKEQGIQFVIATGNHPDKVARYFKNFLGQYQLIANNGAQIIVDGQLQAVAAIPAQVFAPLGQLAHTYRHDIRMGMVFTGQSESYMLADQAQIGNSLTTARGYFQNLKVIDDVAEIKQPIAKITIEIPVKEHVFMADVRHLLGKQVHVTTSGYGSVDIVNSEVNKGAALAKLAEIWQINSQEMMAFGDGLNDAEMLNYVGQPIAMPNSDPLLLEKGYPQALADNNHDGVLKTIVAQLSESN
ncbi:HAD-IIB family hydrolase [Convivina intestini]|uniref:Sugar-phosphatase n=1 Tax=Convivina intestini TaxID=1505726 RepID=A0A2U1DC51_9LACO|nr:HAD family hydrolase [Convivina intestini]PVY85264.1 hypothetical protein C7384_10284 [Convivina intestini]CAH1852665.1 Sugar phosphatase YbiV [Convivina intestini]SDB87005.1 hypothetical protein SAMN05216341_102175 [Leuconostocaceae bacterium R-53105]